jgi:hypothetical protein
MLMLSYHLLLGLEVSFFLLVSEKHPQDVTRFNNISTKSYGKVVSVINNGKWSGFTPRPLYPKERTLGNIVEEAG